MKQVELRVFSGPSIHSKRAAVRIAVEAGGLPQDARNRIADRLPQTEPWEAVTAILDQVGEDGSEIAWAHALGALAVHFQDEPPEVLLRHWSEPSPYSGVQYVIAETVEPRVGRRAMAWAFEIVSHVFADDGRDQDRSGTLRLAERMDLFHKVRSEVRYDANTRMLVDAARDRGIPVVELMPSRGLLLFGQGRKRQRYLNGFGDATGAIAGQAVRDWSLAADLLRLMSVPVPTHRVVRSAAEAGAAARNIRCPVVLKRPMPQGRPAVEVRLSSPADLPSAANLLVSGEPMLVERWIDGDDYMLTIAGGRLVAAAPDVAEDLTPEIRQAAERAARGIGLEQAVLHIRTPDIARPLSETGGAVVAVEGPPDLASHDGPSVDGREDAGAVIDHLFPEPARARIPTVAVTGTNGKTTTCRMLRHILRAAGCAVGTATTNELTMGDETLATGEWSGMAGALRILQDPAVEAGIFEVARRTLLRLGTGWDVCDVGMITNVTDDHVGQDGIVSLEQIATIKRLVVELATKATVLNADNRYCRDMAGHAAAPLWWVSRRRGDELIARHLATGGDAILLDGVAGVDTIVHCRGGDILPVIAVSNIPATLAGAAAHNVENAMMAVAAARALGQSCEAIQGALAAFQTDYHHSPGRLNILRANGICFVLDYAHNEDGMRAICQTVSRMEVSGRRICVVASVTSTRRDAHYEKVSAAIAPMFEVFVVSEVTRPRGRPKGEVVRLLAEGLTRAGVPPSAWQAAADSEKAVDVALAMARPGDLVLVLADDYRVAWAKLQAFCYSDGEAADEGEPTSPPDAVSSPS